MGKRLSARHLPSTTTAWAPSQHDIILYNQPPPPPNELFLFPQLSHILKNFFSISYLLHILLTPYTLHLTYQLLLTSSSTVNTQLLLILTSYKSPRSFTKNSLDLDLDLSVTCRI